MTKNKLPILSKPVPASAQRELTAKAVASVKGASRPEFPTRSDLYRKAGLIGGATLLASGLAYADPAAKPSPPRPPEIAMGSLEDGSINGKPLTKGMPKINVYREGGGIGPSEDMWKIEDVEAFMSWTMAHEGKLALQTKYKLTLDGVTLTLDGFDPARNIGYAYIDPRDGDAATYTPAIRTKLDDWMKAQKVAILFVEVKRYPDVATLHGKVVKFLHAVQKAPPAAGPLAPSGLK